MTFLLDTHALWHHASDGDGLSALAAATLDRAPTEDLCVLDVSLYELARQIAVGRIRIQSPLQALRRIEEGHPILRTDAAIAWRSASMDWPKRSGRGQHLDPADRALVAAAMIHRLTLVTADEERHHYAAHAGVSVLW